MNKFKWIYLLLIVVILVASSFMNRVALAENNFLANGDFEADLTGWTARSATLTRVTTGTYNNSKGAAKVSVTGNNGTAVSTFQYVKGMTYSISVWVKLESGSDVAQIILDHTKNGPGLPKYEYLAKETRVSTTWTQLKQEYEYTGDNDSGTAEIYLRIADGSPKLTFYFDDFKVLPSGAMSNIRTSKILPGEIAINGGFETGTKGWSMNGNVRLVQAIGKGYDNSLASGRVQVYEDYASVGQEVEFQRGKTYKLSAYIKLDGGDGEAAFVIDHSRYRGDLPLMEFRETSERVSSRWTKIEANYTYGGSMDTGKALVYIRIGSGRDRTTYYIDDFSIVDSDPNGKLMSEDKNMPNFKLSPNTSGTYRIVVNGRIAALSQNPYLSDSAMMVSAVDLMDILGGRMAYDQESGKIILSKEKDTIEMRNGSKFAQVNYNVKPLTAKPELTETGVFLPVRFVCEAFGGQVSYHSELKTVMVSVALPYNEEGME